MPLKIMIVADQPLFRKGLQWLLKMEEDMLTVAEADNGAMAVQYAKDIQPDVVVMDITLSVLDGINATRQIVAENPDISVLTLSSESDFGSVVKALEAGAKGYITKDAAFAELAAGIRAVAHGKSYLCRKISELILKNFLQSINDGYNAGLPTLSTQELAIMRYISDGKNTWHIAHAFEVSDDVINRRFQSIMNKADLYSIKSITKYAT
ncbi:MAG: response regulator transcription factor [Desulfuromonadales bacterium]|nr:response regulator transcription factor [Desulfuromonadales bacterium]